VNSGWFLHRKTVAKLLAAAGACAFAKAVGRCRQSKGEAMRTAIAIFALAVFLSGDAADAAFKGCY
jgi:hypothetical protein